MPRLRNRNKAIPGGLVYRQPETGFRPPAWTAFDAQVQIVMGYRRANPKLVKQYEWSVNRDEVAAEIDSQLAQACIDRGFAKMVSNADPEAAPTSVWPKKKVYSRLGAVVGGARTLVNWLKSGADAVSSELSTTRAATCLDCKHHGSGGYEAFFTKAVSGVIQSELNKRREWKLSTPHDDALNVCEVCLCPLKLKIHMPLDDITKLLPPDIKEELPPHCWILTEEEGQKS